MNVLSIMMTLPAYALRQFETAVRVENKMIEISALTGQPIETFYSEAMEWCSRRVSGTESSLDYARNLIASGKRPPWESDR